MPDAKRKRTRGGLIIQVGPVLFLIPFRIGQRVCEREHERAHPQALGADCRQLFPAGQARAPLVAGLRYSSAAFAGRITCGTSIFLAA